MKVFEIVYLNKDLLKIFQETGIRPEDVRYIDLFNEYRTMVANEYKVSYIVASLATKYGISERKVYYLIKLFKSDCIMPAAQNAT